MRITECLNARKRTARKRDVLVRTIAAVEIVAQSSAGPKDCHQGVCRQLLGITGFGDDTDDI
jgi:hypothetical protein